MSPLVELSSYPLRRRPVATVHLNVTEAMKPHVRRLAAGQATSCFALSEPGAGSDVWAVAEATRNGGSW